MVQTPAREAACREELDRYRKQTHCCLVSGPSHAGVVVSCNCWVFVLEVKRYVRKGVPYDHRARIWMAASGAQEQLESNPGYYKSLLAAEHDGKLEETIRIGATTGLVHGRHFDNRKSTDVKALTTSNWAFTQLNNYTPRIENNVTRELDIFTSDTRIHNIVQFLSCFIL